MHCTEKLCVLGCIYLYVDNGQSVTRGASFLSCKLKYACVYGVFLGKPQKE